MLAPRPPRVIVYKSDLLPRSETFIREQVRSTARWRPVLTGEQRVPDGLDLSGLDVLLLDTRKRLAQRLADRLRRRTDEPARQAVHGLRAHRPALVHAHFGVEAVKAWPLAHATGVPLLATLHGYDIQVRRDWWEAGHAGAWMAQYPARLQALAARPGVHFVAVSDAIRRRAIDFGIAEDKVTCSPIGVDTDAFRPGAEPVAARRRVLFVGRLVEKKGCRHLLEAFAAVQDRFPETALVIAGTGPLEAELRELALQRRVRARFTGMLTPAQVRAELDRARVFCLPSVTAANGDAEGLPIVLLEAQACGVPVITSAGGRQAEGVVDGVTGFAHAEGDVPALAQALSRLLADDALAEAMGAAAREHMVRHFDILDCTARLEALYDRIAGAGNRTTPRPA